MYCKTYVSKQTNIQTVISLKKGNAKVSFWTKWDRYNMK